MSASTKCKAWPSLTPSGKSIPSDTSMGAFVLIWWLFMTLISIPLGDILPATVAFCSRQCLVNWAGEKQTHRGEDILLPQQNQFSEIHPCFLRAGCHSAQKEQQDLKLGPVWMKQSHWWWCCLVMMQIFLCFFVVLSLLLSEMRVLGNQSLIKDSVVWIPLISLPLPAAE